MDRLEKYQDSINRFFKNKSCIADCVHNIDEYAKIVNEGVFGSDKIFSALMLTIMNNQGKNPIYKIHGYYVSVSIELVVFLINYSNLFKKKSNIINYVLLKTYQSISKNLDFSKKSVASDNFFKSSCYIYKVFNTELYSIFYPKELKPIFNQNDRLICF